MKSIIIFYQKAKDFDNLSVFFEACSNVEIEEYRDYERAIAALKESIKYMSKSSSNEKENRLENLTTKRNLIQKFIDLIDLA